MADANCGDYGAARGSIALLLASPRIRTQGWGCRRSPSRRRSYRDPVSPHPRRTDHPASPRNPGIRIRIRIAGPHHDLPGSYHQPGTASLPPAIGASRPTISALA
jgi:hypothetical protein